MRLIDKNNELIEFCNIVSDKEYITVDLEFIREKTYYPKLCLIQIGADDNIEACIDPLEKSLDLSPVIDLMKNKKIIKVFHAARQDLEIFYNIMGEIPAPLFDTQVAAMVCGFGESVGYQTLAAKLLNKNIDKTMRFSNWEARPLNNKQIEYATSDVTYLREIYKSLKSMLADSKRTHWVDEEMQHLSEITTYVVDENEVWKKLKPRTNNRKFLAIAKEVACWREQQAKKNNVPRKYILRDDAILEIAAKAPKDISELAETRGVNNGILKSSSADQIVEAVQKGLDTPSNLLPKLPSKHKINTKTKTIVELLKVLLNIKCEENDVASKIIASKEDLEEIACNDTANVPALKGWRKEIFGNDALLLKNGKIALALDNETGKLKIISI